MAVLQQNPLPFQHRTLDRFLSNLSLSLSQGNNREVGLETSLLSKSRDFNSRVSSGTKNEDERCLAVRVSVSLFKVEWRRLDVLFPIFFTDHGLHGLSELV